MMNDEMMNEKMKEDKPLETSSEDPGDDHLVSEIENDIDKKDYFGDSLNNSFSDRSWEDRQDDDDSKGHWKASSESLFKNENSTTEIKVAVDWVELEGALENNSPELHSFLNTITGDVVRVFEGSENAELKLKQSDASPDFLYIDPVSSREQYRWMEEFIEIVEEPTLKDKLNIAIDGKGAFRRFKDVLAAYPTEREKWFVKRSIKLREHMNEWLKSKHIVATNTPPWEGDGQTEERRIPRGDFEMRNWNGTADLKYTAHELIDMIPSKDLPTAVAFLEFLRNRRPYKQRPRFS